MRITISEIDLASEQATGASATSGYRVRFTSDLTNGTAIFVPGCDATASLLGASFEVEVGQETVDSFAILPRGEAWAVRLTALETNGDYEVVGLVGQLSVRGDDPTRGHYLIHTGSAYFYVDSEDVGALLEEGDYVRFVVRGLSLWDEAV